MALDPVRVEDTRAWLLKASNDLRAAEVVLAAGPPLLGDAMFHCQQAVEKAMKGFLTWLDSPFPKTHNLAHLGDQCVELDRTLESVLRQVPALTEYAWKFRYPGQAGDPTLEEARASLALARQVFQVILDRLPVEVRA